MLKEEVQSALNTLRPSLQADGGDVDLVDVTEDGTVKVKLKGACAGCPMSQMTLSQVIEKQLKSKVPGVQKLVAV